MPYANGCSIHPPAPDSPLPLIQHPGSLFAAPPSRSHFGFLIAFVVINWCALMTQSFLTRQHNTRVRDGPHSPFQLPGCCTPASSALIVIIAHLPHPFCSSVQLFFTTLPMSST